VVEVSKDERFFALQKDSVSKSLDAVAPITTKLTVENTLTKSSIIAFGEKTDSERKRGIQSSKISDEVRGRKGNVKDQKSVFRASTTFSKSIRRNPVNESASLPSHPMATSSSMTQSNSSTPSITSSSTPPNDSSANASPPANGAGTEGAKKEFKFKLPAKRKAESPDGVEQAQKKQKTGEDSPNGVLYTGNLFGFLSKFSELSSQIHFVDPDRDRPPRRLPVTTLEQFELFRTEYADNYRQYEQLFCALDRNRSDFIELGQLYNSKGGTSGAANGIEKKDIEITIQEVHGKRKELLDRMRRRYNYLHDELRDLEDCLHDYVRNLTAPQ